jgi:hypothetical protein
MKKNFARAGLVVLSSLLILVSIWSVPEHKAQATTMSPTRLELDADPGKKIQSTIKIYNDGDSAHTFYLSAAKFETKDETGQPEFVPEDKEGLVSWFSFAPSIDIAPKQSKEVPIFVTVPANAEPGGYFAAVFASIIPPASKESGAVAVQTDTGTLVLFRVNGQFPISDSILEFNTKNKKHWLANLPVEFYFRFQNSGSDRAQPLGDITIKNLFGSITKIVTANKGAGNVLPQSIRRFESAWVTSGGDQVEQNTGAIQEPKFTGYWSHVQYEWHNFAFGRYHAHLNVTVNNDSSRSHAKDVSFWVIPWHLLLLILVGGGLFFGIILVLAIIVVAALMRSRKR